MHVQKLCALFALLAAALPATTQDRKPGQYEVTMITTTVSPSARVYPPRTRLACLTPEMIDKYGAIVPEQFSNVCHFANVVKKPGGMTADMICSGSLNGSGTIEVNWSDSEHAKGTLHFAGTMHPRDSDIKIEWTAASTAVYKGPDCSATPSPTPPPAPQAAPSPQP